MSFYENQMWAASARSPSTGAEQTANQDSDEQIVANLADELDVSVRRLKNALIKAHEEAGADPTANTADGYPSGAFASGGATTANRRAGTAAYTDGTIGGDL